MSRELLMCIHCIERSCISRQAGCLQLSAAVMLCIMYQINILYLSIYLSPIYLTVK